MSLGQRVDDSGTLLALIRGRVCTALAYFSGRKRAISIGRIMRNALALCMDGKHMNDSFVPS